MLDSHFFRKLSVAGILATLLSSTLLFSLSAFSFPGFDFRPIITCNEDQNSSSRAIVIDKDMTPGAHKNFQIVIKSQNILHRLERCLELNGTAEYQTFSVSPAFGVFLGEIRQTSLGRGKNRARLVAEHYEDTRSVVLKCDYAVGTEGDPRWIAHGRITLFGCETHSEN